jgi:hypothetical protein
MVKPFHHRVTGSVGVTNAYYEERPAINHAKVHGTKFDLHGQHPYTPNIMWTQFSMR